MRIIFGTFFFGLLFCFQQTKAQNECHISYPADNIEFAKDVIRASKDFQPYLVLDRPMTIGSVGIPIVNNVLYQRMEAASFDVIQVIDSENAILENERAGKIWISGLDTATLTDESRITINEPCLLVGNKTYQTVIGGSKTVLHFELHDLPQELVALQTELNQNPKAKKDPYLRIRNWKIDSKDSSLFARFCSYDGKTLRLEKFTGEIVSLNAKSLPGRTKSEAKKLQLKFNKEIEGKQPKKTN